mgnify:CR=1 FL=1
MLTIHIVGYVYCNTHEIVIVAGVFHDTFTRLGHIQPEIVYPIPNFGALSQAAGPLDSEWNVPKTEVLFLSIDTRGRKIFPLLFVPWVSAMFLVQYQFKAL